ncbi:hypothetical protein DRN97_08195 [Methanosarcinales archaeon]|nr:MAG: hypothetical protein DRN97_08195 [Methanosarcinales archaeon]
MKNYIVTINRFFVVPIIYQRKNTNMKRIMANLVPPLDVWAGKAYLLDIWRKIIKSDVNFLDCLKGGKHSVKSGAELMYYSIL